MDNLEPEYSISDHNCAIECDVWCHCCNKKLCKNEGNYKCLPGGEICNDCLELEAEYFNKDKV